MAERGVGVSVGEHETGSQPSRSQPAPFVAAAPLWLNAGAAIPGGWATWRAGGLAAALRFAAAMAGGAVAQGVFVARMGERLGAAPLTAADHLTLGRAALGTTLLALVAAGTHDRAGPSGRFGFASVLLGATVADWVDGPVARRLGSTDLGAVLDIEADSLLTLGAAAAAVAWGGLPKASLLPPLLRYADPVRALRRGRTFVGGGPWWCRLSGAAQMGLFLAALSPWPTLPDRRLGVAAALIGATQAMTQAMQTVGRRPEPCWVATPVDIPSLGTATAQHRQRLGSGSLSHWPRSARSLWPLREGRAASRVGV